ncbi:hypothetical protein [Lysinibacillus sp. fls2-241-R2A-57]|nr:hypothetical protein [Lysinibacillus sp. fls2-241-R2A-57]
MSGVTDETLERVKRLIGRPQSEWKSTTRYGKGNIAFFYPVLNRLFQK